ncbi:MAG: translocation/assembly module TamB domain-containing protein [Acidobacteria bacterium]|nr:translocation/assembly module TamB domain-containing protein [Acidobacteriota bacterium]
MAEEKEPKEEKPRLPRAARLSRALRIPHPHLPHLSLTQVRVLRLYLLLALLSGLAVYAVFRSSRFQDLLRRKCERVLTAELGRKVTIGGFDVALFPPSVLVREVALENDPRGLQGACFAAEEIAIQGLPFVWGDRVEIPKIRVSAPRVVFEVFPDGTSNFGNLGRKGGSTGPPKIDIRVEEAVVQKGTFRFREWKARIDTVVQNTVLTGSSGAYSLATTFSLGSRHGQFRIEDYDVLKFHLGIEAVLSPGRVHLTSVRLRSDRISLDASGGIDDLRKPVVRLAASALSTGRALRELFGLGLPLEGLVATSGTIRITPGAGFRIRGRFEIPDAIFGAFPMKGHGFVRVDPKGLIAQITEAEYAGGSLQGFVRLSRLDRPPLPIRLAIRGRGLGFERFLADIGPKGTGLLGSGDLDALLAFDGKIEEADGWADLALSPVQGARSQVPGRNALALSGGGPLLVRKGVIEFRKTPFVLARSTQLTLSGTLPFGTWTPDLAIDLVAPDLTEVERIAENLYPALQGEPLAPPLELSGSGRLTGRFERSFSDPRISGHLAASDFVLRKALFGEVSADFVVDHQELTLAPFAAELPPTEGRSPARLGVNGRVSWGGKLAGHYLLRDFTSTYESWPIERVMTFLDMDLPLTGRVTGTLPLEGETPGVVGRVALGWDDASIWGQNVSRLDGTLAFETDRVLLQGVTGTAAEGSFEGSGFWRYDGAYEVELAARRLRLAGLTEVASGVPEIGGLLSGRLDGKGTRADPELRFDGEIEEGTWGGKPLAKAGEAVEIRAELAGEALDVRAHAPSSATLSAHVSGSGAAPGTRAARITQLDLEVRSLATYAALLGAPEEAHLDGHLAIEASVQGSDARGLAGSGTLRNALLEAYGHEITASARVPFAVREGELVFTGLELSGRKRDGPPGKDGVGTLAVSGSLGLLAPYTLALAARGSVDASLVTLALPGSSISGQVVTDLRVAGPAEKPVFSGRLLFNDVDYATAGGTSFRAISGGLQLSPGRVLLDGISMRFGGGTVDLDGSLGLSGLDVTSIRLNAHLDKVRNEPFPGFRATVSGDLALTGDDAIRTARGDLVLERGLYTEDLDLGLGALLGRLGPSPIASVEPSALDNIALDVRIGIPRGAIEVRNNVARVKANGDLQARGTFGRPLLFGKIEAEEGGRLTLRGLKYELNSGDILFANPVRIEPFFDLSATTSVREYQISFELTGTAKRLAPRFSSYPQLSDAQIVSLLANGELPTSSSFAGSAPVSTDQSVAGAARDLLASVATDAVAGRTKELFRLDRLNIDPVFQGSTFDAPKLTIGKQIAKDLTVTYSYKAATSNQEQLVVVDYQISPRVLLQFVRDEQGVYSVEVKIRQVIR